MVISLRKRSFTTPHFPGVFRAAGNCWTKPWFHAAKIENKTASQSEARLIFYN